MADLHTRLLAELHAERYDSPTEMRLAATLGAVVELHAPIEQRYYAPHVWLECSLCYEDAPDIDGHVDHERWPCSTIQAIADQLGVDHDS